MSYYPSRPHQEAEFGDSQDSELLGLRDILAVLRRRVLVILLVAAVCVAATVGFSLLQAPTYQSSIQMLVGGEGTDEGSAGLSSGSRGLERFTATAVELAQSRTVAEAVISELGLSTTPGQFLANMSVQQAGGTQVIEISYTSSDPQQAQGVANAIGEVFSEQVSEASSGAVTATVWEQAEVPEGPVSPNPLRNGALALVLGLMLGVGLAFLLEYFDDSWRSPAEAEKISGAPTFGVITEAEHQPLAPSRRSSRRSRRRR